MKQSMFLLVLLFFSRILFAQHGSPPHGNPEDMAKNFCDTLEVKLNIKEDTKAKIYDLTLQKFKDEKSVMQQYRDDRETGMAKMKAINKDYEAQMEKILSPEQFAKLKEMQPKHEPGKPGGSGDPEDRE